MGHIRPPDEEEEDDAEAEAMGAGAVRVPRISNEVSGDAEGSPLVW